MKDRQSIRVHYLDASVLVKIVADDPDEEPGRDAFRAFYFNNSPMFTATFCVAECLSAFKLKFRKGRISADEYIRYVREFYRLGVGHKLQIEDVNMLLPDLRAESERLIATYGLDFIDALQVITLLRGRYRYFVDGSQSLLVTADRELAKVARTEGAKVWECTTEATPPE